MTFQAFEAISVLTQRNVENIPGAEIKFRLDFLTSFYETVFLFYHLYFIEV